MNVTDLDLCPILRQGITPYLSLLGSIYDVENNFHGNINTPFTLYNHGHVSFTGVFDMQFAYMTIYIYALQKSKIYRKVFRLWYNTDKAKGLRSNPQWVQINNISLTSVEVLQYVPVRIRNMKEKDCKSHDENKSIEIF